MGFLSFLGSHEAWNDPYKFHPPWSPLRESPGSFPHPLTIWLPFGFHSTGSFNSSQVLER